MREKPRAFSEHWVFVRHPFEILQPESFLLPRATGCLGNCLGAVEKR